LQSELGTGTKATMQVVSTRKLLLIHQTYVNGIDVFAVSEHNIDKLVNSNILANQNLGVENS